MPARKRVQWRNELVVLSAGIPMLLASALVAGVVWIVTRAWECPWYVWLALSPALYVVWLVLFLGICANGSKRLGKTPKPRQAIIETDMDGEKEVGPDAAGIAIWMFRATFVRSLPMVQGLEKLAWFRILMMRAYSPSVHVGNGAMIWGLIMDPDLTEIGDRAVIGLSAELVAHSLTRRPGGVVVYLSAPIKIGADATIGGAAYVGLGCVIGEGAVVEAKSFVAPFTNIPAGETWGGVPARRLRRRDGQEEPIATGQIGRAADLEQARELVQFALGAKDAEPIPQWDSLGQIAIASALSDRYGIAVGSEKVFCLQTLEDVARAIGSGGVITRETAEAVDAAGAPPGDADMLPLLPPAEATQVLAARFAASLPERKPLRVAIAASSTAQALAPTMRVWGRAFGLELDIEFAGYNQIVQTLLELDSHFAKNESGVNIVFPDPSDRAFDSARAEPDGVEELFAAVEAWIARQPQASQTLVGTLPPQISAFSSLERAQYEPLRRRWNELVEGLTAAQVFDFAAVVEQMGAGAARSSASEALARMPYSPALYQACGIALVRQILAARRTSAKVIAVDCDNTLWGGVVGEVGMEGIELGPEGRGRSFQLFQQRLKQLKERGLLLALVSKNEEGDVLRVFESHPEMILRPDDIAAWRVNWKHKSENLEELAEELNLGVDSFVFLDDDPAVRMEVSTRLSGVHVVPMPDEPALYCETLERLWLFDGVKATEADHKRTRMMQEEALRKRERRATATLEEYLERLQLEVEIREPQKNEWPRVAQLTQRTNQFNLSLRRRTLEEARALGDVCPVLIVRARDRFGDYGLVGVCVLANAAEGGLEIDTLLMSCRVLGRGVEDAFLHAISGVAAGQGAAALAAPFVPGPRNQLIKEFLVRSGFREVQRDYWKLALVEAPRWPAHIRPAGEEGAAAGGSD
jgi:FkbH-like protein